MSPEPGNARPPNLPENTSFIYLFFLIQWFRDKLPISPPSSPRLLSASRQTEGIFPSPTPLGLSEKPGFSQELTLAPPQALPTGGWLPAPSPRPAPLRPTRPGPSSLLSRTGALSISSSQTAFVPLGDPPGVSSHCAPARATLSS